VTGPGPVLRPGRAFGDVDHALKLWLGLPRLGWRRAGRWKRVFDLLGQLSLGPDVEGLVNRLVRHPHLRIVREFPSQPSRDLLGTVPLRQAFHDLGVQATARHQLCWSAGPASVLIDLALGDHRPVSSLSLGSSPVEFAGDRGPVTTQQASDPGRAVAGLDQVLDSAPVDERQPTACCCDGGFQLKVRHAGSHPASLGQPGRRRASRHAGELGGRRDRCPRRNSAQNTSRTSLLLRPPHGRPKPVH
jgi:hypothetical protein